MSDPKSGSLSPPAATQETLQTGIHHLHQALPITLIKAFFGGLLLSAAGHVSLSVAGGSPDLSPGLQHLLQGLTFPIGLVIIYFVGADLYTGYPMWFTLAALERRGTPWLYVSRAAVSWLGDLAGTLFFAYFFTHLTRSLGEEPFHSGVVRMITEEVVDPPWHIIFLRAVPCGFLVTMAMFLGTQNHDGISKALGLHLPLLPERGIEVPAHGRVHVSHVRRHHDGGAAQLAGVLLEGFASYHVGQYGWRLSSDGDVHVGGVPGGREERLGKTGRG